MIDTPSLLLIVNHPSFSHSINIRYGYGYTKSYNYDLYIAIAAMD